MLGILYDLDCLDVDNIIPQFRIGKFKVDFMVITQLGNKLVIECDGHDFHEKTKTQAQYDKERDRFLMSKGYTVFHFTGSELYNNFIDIENEIFDYLCTEWESSK
jgi:very-short-patch-repair endonuclease